MKVGAKLWILNPSLKLSQTMKETLAWTPLLLRQPLLLVLLAPHLSGLPTLPFFSRLRLHPCRGQRTSGPCGAKLWVVM